MGPGTRPDITSTVVTTNLFRGNPRLLIGAIPFALAIVLLKAISDVTGADRLELSPLLAGAIGAEVFILGFLLTGTAGDFKEAERLPGEVSASLETMADECLITFNDIRLPEARTCLEQLVEVAHSIREWLLSDEGLDEVLSELRALNGPFTVMAPAIQAGFTTRLKSEQAGIRKLVLRMDTMRRTSYVSAGYLIAEVTALLLVLVMIFTDLGPLPPTLCLVGLISYLIFYLVTLIRDLDNPFEYRNGVPGAADVSLEVLERTEDRLRALLRALDVGLEVGLDDAEPLTS
jgi:predicted membrane chloride channel (bestrophin family)